MTTTYSFILKLVEKLHDGGQNVLKILKLVVVGHPLLEFRKTEKTPALPHEIVLFWPWRQIYQNKQIFSFKLKSDVTAEVSSLTRLTNDAFRVQIQDTSFRLKCLRLRCHDFSALAD